MFARVGSGEQRKRLSGPISLGCWGRLASATSARGLEYGNQPCLACGIGFCGWGWFFFWYWVLGSFGGLACQASSLID
jgi:hypothetical protein